jgi:hypothetical protein
MIPEVFVVKEIFNILSSAGIPKADLNFWKGASNLDFAACQALALYLRVATSEEVNKLNDILKEKISVFKSGDASKLNGLFAKEREFIFQ